MNYYWKVFLWENGGKTTEYTDYLTFPIFFEDRLDETLDSGEIVLENMPIATRDAFPPKTKFRIERYITAECTDTPRKWDLIVEHDDVEEYAGLPEVCCHRIHLIEPSVVAQGMHVDNIALTYELQDVSLNYKTVVSKTDTLGDLNAVSIAGNGYSSPVQSNPPMQLGIVYFRNSYRYVWSGDETLKDLIYEQDARTAHAINFTIPTLTA